ncbi:MAG: hypothetical protein ACYC6N_29940 [Pirellulaceae bacterium]
MQRQSVLCKKFTLALDDEMTREFQHQKRAARMALYHGIFGRRHSPPRQESAVPDGETLEKNMRPCLIMSLPP